jgi:hypothetical protein
MKLTRKNRSTRVKTCDSATLSTTNPKWTDPGSKPGLRGERSAISRLSYGTAIHIVIKETETLPFAIFEVLTAGLLGHGAGVS